MNSSEFRELILPSNRTFKETSFHAGKKKVLMDQSHLVPPYIRDGKEFDDDNGEEDYYTICTISGNLDQAARFLSGHILMDRLYPSENIVSVVAKESRTAPLNWVTAVVANKDYCLEDVHDQGTVYSWYGTEKLLLPMYRFKEPVEIKSLLEIPALDFSPNQLEHMYDEGVRWFNRVTVKDPKSFQYFKPFPYVDESTFSQVYSLCRQVELAVKSKLLGLDESFC
jgi:hypothetical protein